MKLPLIAGSCGRVAVGLFFIVFGLQPGVASDAEAAAGWSEPVSGLSMRLVVEDRDWTRRKDPCHFVLEVKNVSSTPLTLEEPHLMPTISASEDGPYDTKDFRCRIIAEPLTKWEGYIMWAERVPTKASSVGYTLAPGGLLRLKITCRLSGEGDVMEEAVQELSNQNMSLINTSLIEREKTVSFSYTEFPGRYAVKAILEIPAKTDVEAHGENWWHGRLESPPVEVTVHRPDERQPD